MKKSWWLQHREASGRCNLSLVLAYLDSHWGSENQGSPVELASESGREPDSTVHCKDSVKRACPRFMCPTFLSEHQTLGFKAQPGHQTVDGWSVLNSTVMSSDFS